jgi:hypothetical protein
VVIRHRLGALYPCGDNHIAQHCRTGGDALLGKLLARRRSGPVERAIVVKLVGLADVAPGVVKVVEKGRPLVANRLHRPQERLYIGSRDIRADKDCLKIRVDVVLSGISVRVFLLHPAVVIARDVQRL